MFSSIAHKTKFWSFMRKRFCVVCALNCARILVVRALDCALFLSGTLIMDLNLSVIRSSVCHGRDSSAYLPIISFLFLLSPPFNPACLPVIYLHCLLTPPLFPPRSPPPPSVFPENASTPYTFLRLYAKIPSVNRGFYSTLKKLPPSVNPGAENQRAQNRNKNRWIDNTDPTHRSKLRCC